MDSVTQTNAANAEESASVAVELDSQADALRGVIAVIATAIVLATILAASILLRLLALPSTHAAIAEAIHRVSEAMGPPF